MRYIPFTLTITLILMKADFVLSQVSTVVSSNYSIIWIVQVTNKISHEKIWTWLRKRNLKRETQSLLIAAKNNAIRTNYINPMGRVFANGPGDLGSIPGRIIQKTLKIELDTSLLNSQQYKVRIKGKVEQSRERSSVLPYT